MNKELYLRKLSRAARWRLSYQEAAEVAADYRELLADSGDEDFGDPVQAVRLLEKPKEYHRWLAVFVFLTMIALAGPVGGLYNLPFDLGVILFLPVLGDLWSFFTWNERILVGLPVLGMVLAWGWFRKNGVKLPERNAIRQAAPLLVVQLLFTVAAWGTFWLAASEFSSAVGFLEFLYTHAPWSFRLLRLFLVLGGPLCGGLGIWGLVRARLDDCRWLTVYMWGLTAAGLCTAVLALLSGMSIDTTTADWWLPYVWMYVGLTAAGLLGTGWALC